MGGRARCALLSRIECAACRLQLISGSRCGAGIAHCQRALDRLTGAAPASADGDDAARAELLATYVAVGDLDSARFAWKRFSSGIGAPPPGRQTAEVWRIARALWERDLKEAYVAFASGTWSPEVEATLRIAEGQRRRGMGRRWPAERANEGLA